MKDLFHIFRGQLWLKHYHILELLLRLIFTHFINWKKELNFAGLVPLEQFLHVHSCSFQQPVKTRSTCVNHTKYNSSRMYWNALMSRDSYTIYVTITYIFAVRAVSFFMYLSYSYLVLFLAILEIQWIKVKLMIYI